MIREKQKLLNYLNILTDIALLFLSMLGAYWARFSVFNGEYDAIGLRGYLRLAAVLIPVQLVIYGFCDLYGSFRSKSFREEFRLIVRSNIIMTVITIVGLYIFKVVDASRWLIVLFFIITTALFALKRFLMRRFLKTIRTRGYNTKKVLVIGAGPTAADYLRVIRSHPSYGFACAGYVADGGSLDAKPLGGYAGLDAVLNDLKPDEAVCAIEIEDAGKLDGIVSACEKTGTKISFIPFCYQYLPGRPSIDQFDGIPLINLRRIPLDNPGNAFLKRAFDIIASLILIVLTSPLMLAVAVGVRLSSPGPVIFRQKRVGLNKRIFTMYKFRSMRVNSQSDTAWSTNADGRRTKFGSFIRKYSLDELPQFFNVLRGDMSLVGPRPELPYYVENFRNEIPLYMVKHQVKPGITGLAQINGCRGDTSIRRRVEFDIKYIENWSISLDLDILIRTAFLGFKNNEN